MASDTGKLLSLRHLAEKHGGKLTFKAGNSYKYEHKIGRGKPGLSVSGGLDEVHAQAKQYHASQPAAAPVRMPIGRRGTSDGYMAQGNPTAADENIE